MTWLGTKAGIISDKNRHRSMRNKLNDPNLYKHYTEISDNLKVACLISEMELDQIKEELEKMNNATDPIVIASLFDPLKIKIYRVLEYNFLDNFIDYHIQNILKKYQKSMPNLAYNSQGDDLESTNIFASFATKKCNLVTKSAVTEQVTLPDF